MVYPSFFSSPSRKSSASLPSPFSTNRTARFAATFRSSPPTRGRSSVTIPTSLGSRASTPCPSRLQGTKSSDADSSDGDSSVTVTSSSPMVRSAPNPLEPMRAVTSPTGSAMKPLRRPGAVTRDADNLYSLVNGKIRYNNIAPETANQISAMVMPYDRTTKKAARERCDKEWCLAQIILYDLFDRVSQHGVTQYSGLEKLKGLLNRAVSANKCSGLPIKTKAIQNQLKDTQEWEWAQYTKQKKLYEAAQEEAKQAAKAEEEKRAKGDAQWAKLSSTPGKQATSDLDRFMNEYFLTDGEPDKDKTQRALRLDGLATSSELLRRAKDMGLHTATTTEGLEKLVCIGWDKSRVASLAESTDRKIRQKAVGKREEKVNELIKTHHEFVAGRLRRMNNGDRLYSIIDGAYLITSPQLKDHYKGGEVFRMEVSDESKCCDAGSGRLASFNFGVATGAMLMAQSTAMVDRLVEDADRKASGTSPGTPSRKRKDPPTPASQGHHNKRGGGKFVMLNWEIRIRGRETVHGETRIFCRPRAGHIRFTDKTLTAFKGEINMGGDIGAVHIEGFKLSSQSDKAPPDWNEFSEAAFEAEKEAREREEAAAEKERRKEAKKAQKLKRLSSSQ